MVGRFETPRKRLETYFAMIHPRFPGMVPTAALSFTLLAFGAIPAYEASIDAIFFISVAADHDVTPRDCHIAFWALGSSTDPCREGCSAVGAARIGLNTFETPFKKGGNDTSYLMTLECPRTRITAASCSIIDYPLLPGFWPHDSFVVLRPSHAPVSLGRLPSSEDFGGSGSAEPAWQRALRLLKCSLLCCPCQIKWLFMAAYIGLTVFLAVAWILKTSHSDAVFQHARSTLKLYHLADGQHTAPRCQKPICS
ncbi:uncharacterized protein LOC113147181 [Cyclospora cayetanensis]|uniref:Uncharacterized protein LOC113147181 n=1 Tax=Cyclospora cayetanensis TaxID=88456 RepID=A0A6P6RZ26_9EIME|nr:uncharacterized protein LOC113147181 [Cyclospora cayetanensis]